MEEGRRRARRVYKMQRDINHQSKSSSFVLASSVMRWVKSRGTHGDLPPSPRFGHTSTTVAHGRFVVVFGGLSRASSSAARGALEEKSKSLREKLALSTAPIVNTSRVGAWLSFGEDCPLTQDASAALRRGADTLCGRSVILARVDSRARRSRLAPEERRSNLPLGRVALASRASSRAPDRTSPRRPAPTFHSTPRSARPSSRDAAAPSRPRSPPRSQIYLATRSLAPAAVAPASTRARRRRADPRSVPPSR